MPMSVGRRKLSQVSRESEFTLPSPFLFYLHSAGQIIHMDTGRGGPLFLVCWFKCQSFLETLSQTCLEIMLYQLSGHPLAQSSWLKKNNHHRNQQFSLNYYCLTTLFIILLKILNSTTSYNPDTASRSLIS